MTPDELARMDKDHCIVFTQNYRSYYDKKYDYIKHPSYQLTGDANPEFAFVYNQIPAFDVGKLTNTDGLFKAEKDYNEVIERHMASDPRNAKDQKVDGDLYQVMDKMQMKENIANQIKSNLVMECSKEVMMHMNEVVPVIRLKSAPVKMLPEIVSIVSAQTGVNCMIVFSDMRTPNRMIGLGYDKDGTGLIPAMSNDIVKQYLKGDNTYCIVDIYPKAFSSYRSRVFELFKAGA